MQRRHATIFSTVQSSGAILPMDLLQRIAQGDPGLDGLTPDAYHLSGEKLNEAINRAWNRLVSAWTAFKTAREHLPASDSGTTATRERWLLPLFSELGYGRLLTAKAIEVGSKSYAVSHGWQNAPIHLVSFKLDLDQFTRATGSSAGSAAPTRSSPHSLVQELLNRSEQHMWGFVSNGLQLRILRDNVSLTRQAYVELDLESMMNGEVYSDFVLLWLLCHQSRVEAERPEECWLERWSRAAHEQGTRALEQLRVGVERAIAALGSGFLAHPANAALREQLRAGELSAQNYYRQLLRLVYRLLVLFVAEDREILFHPDADQSACERYTRYYSTARLRRLAEQRTGTRHADLFCGLRLVMEKLGHDQGCPELGLPALDSFLFSREAIANLADCEIANADLLDAIRALAFTVDKRSRRAVDYKNLGSEELGSVYESLLELHPVLHIEAAKFELATAGGNERKTTGSYYTPTSLITCLLDSALEPVLDEACTKPDPESAILDLKVCDPACGSGHFLIAAAHRIARRLAAMRTGIEEPPPEARRRALRDVAGRCIYGVDINPMAVELCKVSLWMEAIEPGKPFTFLDQHIQWGNSLLGTTPALLAQGIPDSAFEPIEGDDKKICSEYRKKNKQQREGLRTLFDEEGMPWERLGDLATGMMQLEEMGDDTVEEVRRKQEYYYHLVRSNDYRFGRLRADAWCAAFVWKKNSEFAYPITEEVFRNIEKNPYNVSTWMRDEIERLANQYKFFHWHLAFPDVFRVPAKDEGAENEQAGWSGGFDVVLGNPPWERIKFQEKEWFASRRPDIADADNAAQRNRMISRLAIEDPVTQASYLEDRRKAEGEGQFVRVSGRYPLCGRGDVNTYAIFAESMRLIINTAGRVGCIVPSGIATDDTTKFFFQNLMGLKALASLYDFENRKKVFPAVDSRMKFCLLTLVGSTYPTTEEADFVFFAHNVEDLQDDYRHFKLSSNDIELLNPNTKTCPIFRSRHDAELNKAIYNRVPVLVNEQAELSPWEAYYMRLIDLSDHAQYLRFHWEERGIDWDIPLYEAKLFWAYDHRMSTFAGVSQANCIAGQPRELTSEEKGNPHLRVNPRYFVPSTLAYDLFAKYPDYKHPWLLVWRDVTNSTNERTCIATVIPRVIASRTCPALGFNSTGTPIVLLTNLNSLIFDYIARQKVGGIHLNFSILKQIPILPPDHYQEICKWDTRALLSDWTLPRALELTYTAWDLEPFAKDCGYNRPPFRWNEERRFLLRCELDAAYFHLYGIARDDADYIMETFPIVKRKDQKKYGEYRTKRVILEIYDELKQAMVTGKPYRTRLEPPPADLSLAHEPGEREGYYSNIGDVYDGNLAKRWD